MSEQPQYQWSASDYVVTDRTGTRLIAPLPKLPLRSRIRDAWDVLTGARRFTRTDAIVDLQARLKRRA